MNHQQKKYTEVHYVFLDCPRRIRKCHKRSSAWQTIVNADSISERYYWLRMRNKDRESLHSMQVRRLTDYNSDQWLADTKSLVILVHKRIMANLYRKCYWCSYLLLHVHPCPTKSKPCWSCAVKASCIIRANTLPKFMVDVIGHVIAHVAYINAIKQAQLGKRLSTPTRSAKDTLGCGDWTMTETVYTLRR